MYITINDIIGSKRIDLSYPIHPTTGRGKARKEITVVSMLSDNVQYWPMKMIMIMIMIMFSTDRPMKILLKMGKEIVLTKAVYMDKELNALIGLELKSQMIDS